MKTLAVALLLTAVTGIAHAADPLVCESSVDAAVDFMTATYGVTPRDIQVQVVSANKKKGGEELLYADVLAVAANHKCVLQFTPGLPRRNTFAICQWSLQTARCDSPDVAKRQVVDETSWVRQKEEKRILGKGMFHAVEPIPESPKAEADHQ